MNAPDWQVGAGQRIGAIYLPLTAALLAGLWRRIQNPSSRLFPAVLLSFLWTLPTLLALQKLNQLTHWWTFPSIASQSGVSFSGMPLELYIGWAILWGVLPPLALSRLPVLWQAIVMALIDLVLMPLCPGLVDLSPGWLAGEATAVALVLLPALLIARWTVNNTHLSFRAALQVALSAMLFLFLIPELTFALRSGLGWAPLLTLPSWERQLALQFIFVLAIPGLNAVQEFATRGRGTPIPYDPPQRLVTSGVYRYVANPMQLSCTLVMFAWAALLRNPWLAAAAASSLIYSAGLAAWDEGQDLAQRFGAPWQSYRAAVHNWLPRRRPYHAGPQARIYIDLSCTPCSQIERWLEHRRPIGLEIVDACSLPHGSIRRMRYDPADGAAAVEGIRAVGRALEHLHLGWALGGAALRLPGICQFAQLVMDASGFGPRPAGQTCEPRQPSR